MAPPLTQHWQGSRGRWYPSVSSVSWCGRRQGARDQRQARRALLTACCQAPTKAMGGWPQFLSPTSSSPPPPNLLAATLGTLGSEHIQGNHQLLPDAAAVAELR